MLNHRTVHGPAFTAAAREKSMKNRRVKNREVLGCTCQQPSEASPCKAAQCHAHVWGSKRL